MCKQVKTYIDEKGKQWETVKEICPRCGGVGVHGEHGWQYYNAGRCFKCDGKGYILKDRRILTEKEKASRERAKQREEEKKELERQQCEAQRKTENEIKLNSFLKENPITYICIDTDSYEKKELLKQNGYKWLTWNWVGFKSVEGVETLELNTDEVINKNTAKLDEDKVNNIVREYWERIEIEDKKVSQYVGAVGDKIEVVVTLESIFGYDTQYGRMYINLFKDEQGNIFKWSSKNTLNIEDGEYKTIKGTIKTHEEYKDQKQTVITRCKVIE